MGHTLQGPSECRISLLRAGSVGNNHPPILTVEVREQIPEVGSLEETHALYTEQGMALANAILTSLPGGTVDILLAELFRRRASLFSAPLRC